jgi:hypothetical protein
VQFCWQQAKDLLLVKPQMDAAGVKLVAISVGKLPLSSPGLVPYRVHSCASAILRNFLH